MYTKEKWVVYREADDDNDDKLYYIIAGDGGRINVAFLRSQYGNNEANAKLIAAAPRSYEWIIKVISQGILSPSRNKELYNEALEIRAEVEK